MEAIVYYLLMLQKYIKLKQNIQKWQSIHCVELMFYKILQSIIWKNRIKRDHKFFSVDYKSINNNEILDRHEYLMK